MYDFEFIGRMIINKDWKIMKVIEAIISEAKVKKNLDIDIKHCRLRRRFHNKLANLYRRQMKKEGDHSVGNLDNMNEKFCLAVEVLDHEPPTYKHSQRLIMVRKW